MAGALTLEVMVHCADLLRNNMNKKFTPEICSDLDYEEMVADVCYENKFVAMITQEHGVDKMEIEIFPSEQTNKQTNLGNFRLMIFWKLSCLQKNV